MPIKKTPIVQIYELDLKRYKSPEISSFNKIRNRKEIGIKYKKVVVFLSSIIFRLVLKIAKLNIQNKIKKPTTNSPNLKSNIYTPIIDLPKVRIKTTEKEIIIFNMLVNLYLFIIYGLMILILLKLSIFNLSPNIAKAQIIKVVP